VTADKTTTHTHTHTHAGHMHGDQPTNRLTTRYVNIQDLTMNK